MWLSLGDPKSGPHFQGDFVGSEADASLIVAARGLYAALNDLNSIISRFRAERASDDADIIAAQLVADRALAKARGEA